MDLFLPGAIAMVLTAVCMPPYINWLKGLQINQFLREEGPKSHAHKAKTPTMGGLVFILTTVAAVIIDSVLRSTALLGPRHAPFPHEMVTIAVIGTGFLCGIIGAVDDGAKVKQKSNAGIKGQIRLAIETLLGGLLWLLLGILPDYYPNLVLPGFILGLPDPMHLVFLQIHPVIFILLGAFLAAATTNAVNLHDGMDGLAAGTAAQVFATLAVMLYATGQPALAAVAATAGGALLGFLLFNKNPAKIFMGDTGSLFIGGLIACLVLAGGLTLWFVPLSAIYIAESISVMAQVTYFKLTKPYDPPTPMSALALARYKLTHKLPGEGKRIFRMAPLHHHYEAVMAEKGWPEWQVVAAFWIVQFLLCVATLGCFSLFLHC